MIKLEFTQQDLNLLANALADRPFKEVAGIIGKINQQYAVQVQNQAPQASTMTLPDAPPAPEVKPAVEG